MQLKKERKPLFLLRQTESSTENVICERLWWSTSRKDKKASRKDIPNGGKNICNGLDD